MKTRVAVYEEGLFDLMGGGGGKCLPPSSGGVVVYLHIARILL